MYTVYIISKFVTHIPQNLEKNYIIKLNDWPHSIDIIFEHHHKTSITNLYVLLKSYLCNKNFIIKYIYIISKINTDENHQDIQIYQNLKVKKLINFNLHDFIDWYETRYETDWEYIKERKYYGFRLVFFKESKAFVTNELFPIYPWNINFIKELNAEHDIFFLSNNFLIKKYESIIIETQELEIKKLKQKIEELEKITQK